MKVRQMLCLYLMIWKTEIFCVDMKRSTVLILSFGENIGGKKLDIRCQETKQCIG